MAKLESTGESARGDGTHEAAAGGQAHVLRLAQLVLAVLWNNILYPGVTSRNGKNRTLRPIERRAGPELALFNLLVQPPAMVQNIVGKELDRLGHARVGVPGVRVEAAHPDVADAVTVHGVLLNPVCQEELYNPGRDVSINPK